MPAYLVLSLESYGKLIPNHKALEEVGYQEIWIPEVEVWYPGAVSLDEISHIIEVQITNKPDLSYLD